MSKEEKYGIIADILEIELDEVKEDTELESFDTWDSVAVLAVISEVESATGKYLHASDILQLKTISDIIMLLGE